MKINTKVKGSFCGELRDSKGNLKAIIALQNNIICDSFFDTDNTLYCYLAVGSGSTTPTETDTALTTEIGTRKKSAGGGWTKDSNTVVDGNIEVVMKQTFSFSLGAISGNVAELGLFTALTAGDCLTHALIKDTNGDPTTISVTTSDQLSITYYMTYILPIVGDPFVVSFDINGVATDVTVSPYFGYPGGWGYTNLGKIIPYSTACGIGLDDITINETTGICSGAALDNTSTDQAELSASSSVANGRIIELAVSLALADFNETFNEIYWLSASTGNLSYAIATFKLDTSITKISSEVMDITLQHIMTRA